MNRFWPATAAGYTIVPTTATSDHCGGVALVFRTNAEWHVEDATAVGPNVVRCVVVHGDERTPLFGVYIPPSEENMTTMNFLTEAMRSVDCERAVVLGDLNVNWHRPREERHHEIVAGLQELSMRNVADGFKTRRHRQHWWSWRQRREGTVVSALCDYVLAGRRVGWRRHSSVDVRFPTDHRMLLAQMVGKRTQGYRRYMRRRQRPPVQLFDVEEADVRRDGDGGMRDDDGLRREQDERLWALQDAVVKPERQPSRPGWISDDTRRLVAKKATALRRGQEERTRELGKALRRSLRRD